MKKVLSRSPQKAPFPYFGGKSQVADAVWQRFGTAKKYVEPFAGSLATLLRRPQPFEGREVVNDMNAWLANFWRALAADPDGVARHADYPISELDLNARGDFIFFRRSAPEFVERIRRDPRYYDLKTAGWWVWGTVISFGNDFSRERKKSRGTSRHRTGSICRSRPKIHGEGFKCLSDRAAIQIYFAELSERLRQVAILCGDWKRAVSNGILNNPGQPTAIFFDPPYASADRDTTIYGQEDSVTVAHEVRQWCLAHGDDSRLRIALCGYDGEHNELERVGWQKLTWKAQGGYSNIRKCGRNENRCRERIWFSPQCLS